MHFISSIGYTVCEMPRTMDDMVPTIFAALRAAGAYTDITFRVERGHVVAIKPGWLEMRSPDQVEHWKRGLLAKPMEEAIP